MKRSGHPKVSIILEFVAGALLLVTIPRWYGGSLLPFPYWLILFVVALLLVILAVKLTPPRGLRRSDPIDDADKRIHRDI